MTRTRKVTRRTLVKKKKVLAKKKTSLSGGGNAQASTSQPRVSGQRGVFGNAVSDRRTTIRRRVPTRLGQTINRPLTPQPELTTTVKSKTPPKKKPQPKTKPALGPRRPGRPSGTVIDRPDITLQPGVVLQPGVLDGVVLNKNSNDPLLLLPMRLEYRVVKRNARLKVLDTADNVKALNDVKASVRGTSRAARIKRETKAVEARKLNPVGPDKLLTVKPVREDHLWFRWFPDSNFSESGIAAPDADDGMALDAFLAADAHGDWPDLRQDAVSQAWQTFVTNVGLSRAIHLMRSRNNPVDDNWGERVGRIAALPKHVKLFALKGDQISEIGQGADIPPNTPAESSAVSYAPTQLNELEWLTDFNAAVSHGMGVRITDQDKVKAALAADWIIAVGVHSGKAEDEVENLLNDQLANGQLEFLAQDAPTNNSPSDTVNYRSKPENVVDETGLATQFESNVGEGQSEAALLLAEALGMEPGVLQKAINANDGAFADAQAMLRVIGPALLDEALDDKTHLTDVSETEYLDAMAAAVVARGALSPMRFGDNAYGIATITDTREMERKRESTDPKDRVEAFMMDHASGLRFFYPLVTDSRVPVISPDDPEASAKLEEVLKINRVSARLDVGEAGQSSTRPIGCPYVDGVKAQHKPGAYLQALRRDSIEKLPDPNEKDRNWPMLYRLARLTLTRNSVFQLIKPKISHRADLKSSFLQKADRRLKAEISPALKSMQRLSASRLSTLKPGAVAGVSAETLNVLRVANKAFSEAVHRMGVIAGRTNGVAQLEVLMLEVFDLFQHRLDAWATGLAYSRLKDIRGENRTQSLYAGYYGMLGKLRPQSATAHHDGYIQAPTSTHATSAAVMRSAYLRHRADGAFAINLRSKRANRALKLLDMLGKGMTLSEALGLRGERWLRDNDGAGEILPLRKAFPLLTAAGRANPTPQRLFDGLALVESNGSGLNGKQKALRTALGEDLDALSDLVTAEAVHLRTLGATDAAAAWLDVLSGGSVPGKPSVLKTQRYGHGSDHRVSLVLPEGKGGENKHAPRTLGEPGFAAMAAQMLPDFDKAFVEVRAALVAEPDTIVALRYLLANDLGMTPMDFVIGGLSEAKTRAGYLAKRSWIEGRAPFADLGQLPAVGAAEALKANVIWDINVDSLETEGQLMDSAEPLRRIGQRARPLDAADLNAAADPSATFDESVSVALMQDAVVDLAVRVTGLSAELDLRSQTLTRTRTAFFHAAFDFVANHATLTAQRLAQQGAVLQTKWSAMQDALWAVSGFAAPEALRVQSVGDMLTGLREAEERAVALETRLRVKNKTLATVAAAIGGRHSLTTTSELNALITQITQSIRTALDGDALPIAPVYKRQVETALLVDGAKSIETALGDWARVRKPVASVAGLLNGFNQWKAYPVLKKAVAADDTDEQFQLAEDEEPPVSHFGFFLSTSDPAGQRNISGFVVDDWTEQRPSKTQDTAIAVNYDTPQSEAPNCLLLCVPPKTGSYAWNDERAAQMVRETITWMKIRALASHDHLVSPTLRVGMNQVAYAGSGNKQTRRIPKASRQFKVGDVSKLDAQFSFVAQAVQNFIPIKLSAVERSGFTRIKE